MTNTREFKLGRRDDSGIDMLNGPIAINMIRFAWPIMLSTLLQLLFNAADLVVVGRFCGEDSIAAVGATSSISNLMVNIFSGLSIGVSVRVSNGFGENSWIKVNKTVHTCIPLSLIGGGIIAVFGIFFSRDVLTAMRTPSDVLDLAATYLTVYFCGMPFNLLYNCCSAVLRADGDTKHPLIFLLISGILNVILNIIFVVGFNLNVLGVALATALTTGLSGMLVMNELMKKNDAARLQIKYLQFDSKATKEILKIGIPASIQQSMFSVANVIIQSSLNDFGKSVVAGSSAAASVLSFPAAIIVGLAQASVNFAGQNYGAKKYDRFFKVKNVALVLSLLVVSTAYMITYLLGPKLLSIYVTDSAEAIEAGMVRIMWIGIPTFINNMFDIISSMMRAMKYSILPSIIAVVGICGVRLLMIYTIFRIPAYHTLVVLYLTYPVSWTVSFIAAYIAFIIVTRKIRPDKSDKSNQACSKEVIL